MFPEILVLAQNLQKRAARTYILSNQQIFLLLLPEKINQIESKYLKIYCGLFC